ncbi:ComF family protein [Streptococcus sp. H49]|uniref:ComF family protein n=1 Tax=Streptococcus huangxiaojuni TaxID=3237239 RepID=UPI0034A34CD3
MCCLLCQGSIEQKETFLDIIFLKNSGHLICPSCWQSFEKIGLVHCPSCFKNQCGEKCSDCLYWERNGVAVCHKALFIYNQAMKDYFSRYKFQGDYLLRKVFASELKACLNRYKHYSIVPVPLSKERYEKRKFNQVEGLLEAANIDYISLLSRSGSVQQSSRSKEERLHKNLGFKLKKRKKYPDNVLIVDDIYTTGATLQSLKKLLYENGIKNVKTFSLAR